jgi:hypothetical protein
MKTTTTISPPRSHQGVYNRTSLKIDVSQYRAQLLSCTHKTIDAIKLIIIIYTDVDFLIKKRRKIGLFLCVSSAWSGFLHPLCLGSRFVATGSSGASACRLFAAQQAVEKVGQHCFTIGLGISLTRW